MIDLLDMNVRVDWSNYVWWMSNMEWLVGLCMMYRNVVGMIGLCMINMERLVGWLDYARQTAWICKVGDYER